MKKFAYAFATVMALATTALASEQCYQVSASNSAWSKTPEMICVDKVGNDSYKISLKTGLSFDLRTIVEMNLNLLERAKCFNCNSAVYGVANPSNSSFNALAVTFDGKIDASTGKEEGTVTIGGMTYFYRSY